MAGRRGALVLEAGVAAFGCTKRLALPAPGAQTDMRRDRPTTRLYGSPSVPSDARRDVQAAPSARCPDVASETLFTLER